MYGILLESVQFYVVRDVGEETWHKILKHAGIKNMIFTTHTTYKDELMISLAKSCAHVTNSKDINEWMTFFGTCFVEFCSGYGYDKLLRVTGRNYRDFLHGIDNIHEVIRFSYPRMQSPSFLVLSEDLEGCILLYQSKRSGFKHYVKGQLQQCAKKFYDVSVNITIIEEMIVEGRTHVKFRLDFDNSVYIPEVVTENYSGKPEFSSITGDRFLQVFPFSIIFNNQLIIQNVGPSMAAFLKGDNLIGCNLRRKFHICRPLIPCIWSKIMRFKRVIFELEYIRDGVTCDKDEVTEEVGGVTPTYTNTEGRLLLRGEMKYIREWDKIAFLCKPLINDRVHLQSTGLFINDLNMFDMSRDMVMAGWQYASQLEFSIERQRQETEIISENMTKIEEWKKKSNSLLYSMIPEAIAERLKSGEQPIDTCEVFDNVTIMFNYMVGFADICANATPMEIVTCINDVFILFDKIVDNYNVFKVETLGDAVYMVAGGVPDRSPDHARNVAGLALELQEKAKALLGPTRMVLSTRIGMHTGSVVGGVVGRRMPQYCLFGDTVNTASRMQTYSLPGRIHLSEPCYGCLKDSDFVTVERGTVNIKGKGEMKTYWLAGKVGEPSTQVFLEQIQREKNQAVVKQGSYDNALDLHGMHASTSAAQISIDLKKGKQNSSRKLTSNPSSTKIVSQNENLSPKRKLPLSSLSSMIQLTEEREPDTDSSEQTKSMSGAPAINIIKSTSLEVHERLVSIPSEDSVCFFINTEEKTEGGDTVGDTGQVNDDKNSHAQLTEQPIHCLISEPDVTSEHCLLRKEVESVVEEESCVPFTGCPLFSSLFKSPVLGCSTCTYVNKEEDITDQCDQTVMTNTQPTPCNVKQINNHLSNITYVYSQSKPGNLPNSLLIDGPNIPQNEVSSPDSLPLPNTAENSIQKVIHTADNNVIIEHRVAGHTNDSCQVPYSDRPNENTHDPLNTPAKTQVKTAKANNVKVSLTKLTVADTTKKCATKRLTNPKSILPRIRTSSNKSNVEVFPSLDIKIKRPRQIQSKNNNRIIASSECNATVEEKLSLIASESLSEKGANVKTFENDSLGLDSDNKFKTSLLSCQNGKYVMNSKAINSSFDRKKVLSGYEHHRHLETSYSHSAACGSGVMQYSECKMNYIKPQKSNSIELSSTPPGEISALKHKVGHSCDVNENTDTSALLLNGNLNNTVVENRSPSEFKSDFLKVCPELHRGGCNKGKSMNPNSSVTLDTFEPGKESACSLCKCDTGIWTNKSPTVITIARKTESDV